VIHLHAYVLLFALAIVLSALGLMAVAVICAVVALALALRSEVRSIFALFWPPARPRKAAPDSW
jgi:hypothetical protein